MLSIPDNWRNIKNKISKRSELMQLSLIILCLFIIYIEKK